MTFRFRELVRFELAYQLRRPWPWLAFSVLALFAFQTTRVSIVPVTMPENFILNSPFIVASVSVIGCLVWLLVGAPIAGEAGARDVQTGLHPLVYTQPLGSREYVAGRFVGALLLNLFVLLGVQLGSLLAAYAPGVDPEIIGPFRPLAYLAGYGLIALPNALIATTLQFAFALRSGRALTAWFASIVLLFLTVPVPILLFTALRDLGPALLADPIGMMAIMNELMSEWTIVEKNVRMFTLDGAMLANRLLWLTITGALLTLVLVRFRFEHRVAGTGWRPFGRRSAARTTSPTPATRQPTVYAPEATLSFGWRTRLLQMLASARASFRALAASVPGLFLLFGYPVFVTLVTWSNSQHWGITLTPRTGYLLSKQLTGPITQIADYRTIVPLLIIYFTGVLIWRERDARVEETVDATAAPEWAFLGGKLLGLTLLLVASLATLTASAMTIQLALGHHDLQLDLYARILLGLQLPEYLLFAVLAFAIHTIVDDRYLGLLATVMAWLLLALAAWFGIEHDLLVYSASPGWQYTDMRGFGGSLGPWLWLKGYWAGWAVLLLVATRLLWVRGRHDGLRHRLRAVRRRLSPSTVAVAVLGGLIVVALGGFVFYDTNVRNDFLAADEITAQRAQYERVYGRFEGVPQPVRTSTRLLIEIQPDRGLATVNGSYRLVNPHASAIDSVHVEPALSVETRVTFDRSARVVLADDRLGHFIYRLDEPLQPGDSLELRFEATLRPRGLRHGGAGRPIMKNGSYFTSGALPVIGYQARRELTAADDRRAHGLPRQLTIVPPGDIDPHTTAAQGATFEAVISTAADQVAVAPGELRRTWREDGRRWFHYGSDVPIVGTETFFSAAYTVHREQRRGVDIQAFVHPGHAEHLPRVLRGARAALDYFSEQFGPYPYPFLQIVEQPGNFLGMGVDGSGVVTAGEGFFLLDPEGNGFDAMFEIVAHEMGHQWWGVQLRPAFAEGGGVISEGLAWYSALQLVKREQGPDALRRFMALMRQPYPWPPIRTGRPLLRAMDPWANYRKAPFALFALAEYIGEDRVNAALRELVRTRATSFATTLDLYRELQAVTPDSLQYLLRDLFERNTFWEFEVAGVGAQEMPSGDWRVALDVSARKMVVDSAGESAEVPMDEWVEIGVFGPPAAGGGELSAPLYLQRHRVRSGRQTLTVTVSERPTLAGVDPFHLLDWVEDGDDDNIDAVRSPPP